MHIRKSTFLVGLLSAAIVMALPACRRDAQSSDKDIGQSEAAAPAGPVGEVPEEKKSSGDKKSVAGIGEIVVLDDPSPDRPKASDKDVSAVVAGNTHFALDLFRHLSLTDGNFFVSPFSISAAMAMVYAGAEGETARQIESTMTFYRKGNQLSRSFGNLFLGGGPRGVQLVVANRLWGQQGHEFKQSFVETIEKYFGARLSLLDLAGNPGESASAINEWVNKQTEGHIPNLVRSTDIDSMTRLLLTNATYFKGKWRVPFLPCSTRPSTFFVGPRMKKEVPFMRQDEAYKHARVGRIQLLSLPYEGNQTDMVVILPPRGTSFPTFLLGLNTSRLADWLGRLERAYVKVHLPKFSITSRFDLGRHLKSMGITALFDMNAEMSPMSVKGDLFIGGIKHQAYVAVDESGTIAAAATEAPAEEKAERKWEVFRADHPFLFLIRDTRNDNILFMGRVSDPSH